jgi:hypothetical protein
LDVAVGLFVLDVAVGLCHLDGETFCDGSLFFDSSSLVFGFAVTFVLVSLCLKVLLVPCCALYNSFAVQKKTY